MIKNVKQLVNNGRTLAERKTRQNLLRILEKVLEAINPEFLVFKQLKRHGLALSVSGKLKLDLKKYKHVYVVGAGKAVYKMALAVEKILGDKITAGFINIPAKPVKNKLKKIKINIARHPTPDQAGVSGSKKIRQILKKAKENDLVLAIISGGGSALLPLPAQGISLKDKIKLTSLLLKTSATIHEINVVRKHLSAIKGGQFALHAYPATVVGLYISDIIGDPFDIQASGPTAPDNSTFVDAIKILRRHRIWNLAPSSIKNRLMKGSKGLIPETPNQKHQVFQQGKIYNFTIGNHNTSLQAAIQAGKKLGYQTISLGYNLQGEARIVVKNLLHKARSVSAKAGPILFVGSGETTVKVRGKGKGGRNQELILAGLSGLKKGMVLVSFGTDGVDGITPRPMAGAMADWSTKIRAENKHLDIKKYLANNDSYHFFHELNEHIITGPSGTNVGDLVMAAVD